MLEVAKHPSPPGNRRPTMTEAYDGRQVVGMDLHRRRSVLVRMTADGRKLETARITNSPGELRRVIARAGKRPKVVLEATYGWYWAADTLAAAGAAAGGVDRPGGDPRAAGADPLPDQAGPVAHQLQRPGPRGAGQAWHR